MTTIDDPRWQQILARDPVGDGRFWYSVETTGIYCRPSCPSRRPLATHVVIHDTIEGARAIGARACLRCDPDGPTPAVREAALVERAVRMIEAAPVAPSLAALAADARISAGHFHRLFKAHTGVTPKAYAMTRRTARARAALKEENSVTEAIYAGGYSSGTRFYADAPAMLGMVPARFRKGGPAETLRFAVAATSLGALLVASSAIGIAAILLGDDPDTLVRDLQDRFAAATLIGADTDYEGVVAHVVALVERPGLALALPLDIRGTAFQRRVWEALRAIPSGETTSYARLAEAIGAPAAVRAVAGACAANAHAIAVPCHRVVRRDGALSGYRWGVERKARLLEAERAAAAVLRAASAHFCDNRPLSRRHTNKMAE